MHHANLEKLKSLRLFGMVRALQELTGLDDRGRLDFDDQLALLIERETADRTNAALEMRLKRAHLRQAACFENLDLKASRSLDKGLIAWSRLPSLQKRARLREHIEWAAVQGVLPQVHQVLRALPEAKWHHMGE